MKSRLVFLIALSTLAACAGLKPINDGQAYAISNTRAAAIAEQAIAVNGPKYRKAEDGISYESTSVMALDRVWHTVEATPGDTAGYTFQAGWRGSAPITASVRQGKINDRLEELLEQEQWVK